MKKYTTLFLIALTLTLPLWGEDEIAARGGGGRGGGRAGGMAVGARGGVGGRASIQRTPTMSRAGAAVAGAAVGAARANRYGGYGGYSTYYYPTTTYEYSTTPYQAPNYRLYPQTGYWPK